MVSCLTYFLSHYRKSLSYSHDVLPEKAIRSPTSTVQGEMAARGDKNAVAGDFFFRGIVGEGLALRKREVSRGDVCV